MVLCPPALLHPLQTSWVCCLVLSFALQRVLLMLLEPRWCWGTGP
jgi:hypothetical protein